jgi:hypothetical protein
MKLKKKALSSVQVYLQIAQCRNCWIIPSSICSNKKRNCSSLTISPSYFNRTAMALSHPILHKENICGVELFQMGTNQAPSIFPSHWNNLFDEIVRLTLFAIRFAHASGDTLCPTKCIGAATSTPWLNYAPWAVRKHATYPPFSCVNYICECKANLTLSFTYV